jgi:hypothetical protein
VDFGGKVMGKNVLVFAMYFNCLLIVNVLTRRYVKADMPATNFCFN